MKRALLVVFLGCSDPLAGIEKQHQQREQERLAAIAAERPAIESMLAATTRIASAAAPTASKCTLPTDTKIARLHGPGSDSNTLLAYRGDLAGSSRTDRRYLHADAVLLPGCAAIVRGQAPPITRHERKLDEQHLRACARTKRLLVVDELQVVGPTLSGTPQNVAGKRIQQFDPGTVRGVITLYELATSEGSCTISFTATGSESTLQLGRAEDRHHVFLVEAVERAIDQAIAAAGV